MTVPAARSRRRILLAACGLLLAMVTAVGGGLLLDRFAAYRSPLARPEPAWTPRQQAALDLAEAARRREEEARQRAERLAAGLTPAEVGHEIVADKGLCFNCHSIAGEGGGTQAPDLAGVATRAAGRVPGLSAADYLRQSLLDPGAYVVEGFVPIMPPVLGRPIELTEDEVDSVVAYLQTLTEPSATGQPAEATP